MKKYGEVKVTAVNAPSGSYAAGCPTKDRNGRSCSSCELNN